MVKKKIFLTGGTGFIGRNILEQLSDEYVLVAPKRTELNLLSAEAVEDAFKTQHFDVVLHCANIGGTYSNPGPQNMVELNLRMFFNLVRCQKYFKKMIYFGSGAEYGKQTNIVRVKEEDFNTRIPTDSYGFYKYVCLKHTEKVDNVICLRLFSCYGKYEDYQIRFISNAICRTLTSMPIIINNKNAVYNYLYIDDLMKIVKYFIDYEVRYSVCNIVPDELIDLLTIAKKIQKISMTNSDIIVRNPGFGLEYTGDNFRLRKELPNFKFTSIDDGIKRLYEWYSQNKSLIDRTKL